MRLKRERALISCFAIVCVDIKSTGVPLSSLCCSLMLWNGPHSPHLPAFDVSCQGSSPKPPWLSGLRDSGRDEGRFPMFI